MRSSANTDDTLMADATHRSRSKSRSRSRSRSTSLRSPPRRRDDRQRSQSPPRRPPVSSRRRYSRSPDRRFSRSPQRSLSQSPRRKRRDSPRRRFSRSPRRRFSRSPPGRDREILEERFSRSPQHGSNRSPPRRRHDGRPKNTGGGFRWKEKARDHDRFDIEDDRRLERGYRNQEKKRARSPVPATVKEGMKEEKSTAKPMKEKKAARNIAPAGETIIVNVNDRLGTKESIPCLASDPISMFV